jgi:hypothetical protein
MDTPTSGDLCESYGPRVWSRNGREMDRVMLCMARPDLFEDAQQNLRDARLTWARVIAWFAAPLAVLFVFIAGGWVRRGFQANTT